VIAAMLGSCMSYKPLPQNSTAAALSTSLKTGDVLKVVMKNGSKIDHLKVISMDSEAIVGTHLILKHNIWNQESVTITNSDIEAIKKRKFSAGKTIALSIGIIPVGLVIYFLLNPPVFRMTL
jgi:hypothetical protein